MTPTPKEKALSLCQKFGWLGSKWKQTGYYSLNLENSKECALIAVDQIIESKPTSPLKGGYIELYSDMIDEAVEYWNEVKKEI